MIKKVSLLFILIYYVNSLIGQEPVFLPKVIPSSPEATMMDRFTTQPVSLFSGVPEISVPIYTIEVNGMQVPIGLNYHASGIKVSDVATWAGLGWNLQAGGAINRRMMGKADEMSGYLNGSYTIKMTGIEPEVQDKQYLENIQNNIWDAEPDIYAYNMPGKSGNFYFANRSVNQPRIIPYNPIKINTTLSGNSLRFQLVDDKGIEYRFGDIAEQTLQSNEAVSPVSSWLLTEMISADKSDTIKFSYIGDVFQTAGEITDYTTVTDWVTHTLDHNAPWWNRYSYSTETSWSRHSASISGYKLQEIKFRNGKVVFERSASNRTDITNKSLSKITIYQLNSVSNTYEVLRGVKLNQSYFYNPNSSPNNYRLKLDAVEIKDKNDAAVQTYGFEYNTNVLLPDYVYSKAKDYWGYYNNRMEVIA